MQFRPASPILHTSLCKLLCLRRYQAETQSQIVEIRDSVVNLRSGDGQVFHEHVKSQDVEEQERPTENVRELDFHRHDLMQFINDNFGGFK